MWLSGRFPASKLQPRARRWYEPLGHRLWAVRDEALIGALPLFGWGMESKDSQDVFDAVLGVAQEHG
jgi:hypothetical protein